METRQLEHEGYEHVDEFRVPWLGEDYQNNLGNLVLRCSTGNETGHKEHGGKRWILKKKDHTNRECWCKSGHPYTEKAGNPKREQAIQDLQQQVDYLNGTLIGSLESCIRQSVRSLQQAIEKLKEAK